MLERGSNIILFPHGISQLERFQALRVADGLDVWKKNSIVALFINYSKNNHKYF